MEEMLPNQGTRGWEQVGAIHKDQMALVALAVPQVYRVALAMREQMANPACLAPNRLSCSEIRRLAVVAVVPALGAAIPLRLPIRVPRPIVARSS